MEMEWLDPWHPIEASRGESFEKELHRELSQGHPLLGLPVAAIGCRFDEDDVLFRIDDGTHRVAVVHLTWRSQSEADPRWPSAEIYADIKVWRAQRMRPEHERWLSQQ